MAVRSKKTTVPETTTQAVKELPKPEAIFGECVGEIKAHRNSVFAVSFSSDGKLIASRALDGTVKLWQMPLGKFITCLFDPAALEKGKQVNQYTMNAEYGKIITYTQPCGSPIPAGAICTCNCIPGTYYVAPHLDLAEQAALPTVHAT